MSEGPSLIETLIVEKLLKLMPTESIRDVRNASYPDECTELNYPRCTIWVWEGGQISFFERGTGLSRIVDMADAAEMERLVRFTKKRAWR